MVDGCLAERDIVHYLRQDSARAHHHHRTEHRITPHSEDALDTACHRRDQGAPDLGIRVVRRCTGHQRIVLLRCVLRCDVESDAARLGLVLDVGRENFHRDRRSDCHGGTRRLLRVRGDAGLHHRDAPRREKHQRFVLVQPAAGVPLPGRALCGVRTRPWPQRQAFPDPGQGRHGAYRPYWVLEYRHVQCLVRGHCLVGADHHHQDRLVRMTFAGVGERVQSGPRHEIDRCDVGKEDHDGRVVALVEHRIEKGAEEMGRVEHLRGEVDGVARRAEGEQFLQATLNRIGHRWHLEPLHGGFVGHHRAGSARNGHQSDPSVRGQGAEACGVRRVQHLLGTVGAHDAVLGEHRVEDGIGAGERGGVRSNRFGAGLGPSRLGEEHPLAACPRAIQRGKQGAAVPHALGVGRHDLDFRACGHPGDALGYRHVALVSGGHPEPDLVATPACEQAEMRPVRTALTDDGDRTRPGSIDVERGAERGEESGRGVVHAEAVGTQDAHPARPRDFPHAPLTGRADRVHLGEARREHHRRAHATLGACLDRPERPRGRHRHDGDIDRARHFLNVGARLDSLYLIAARVDGPQLALEPGFLEVA